MTSKPELFNGKGGLNTNEWQYALTIVIEFITFNTF